MGVMKGKGLVFVFRIINVHFDFTYKLVNDLLGPSKISELYVLYEPIMDEVTISVTAANIRKRLGRRRNPTYVFTEFFYHFSYVSTFNDALQIYISCE